MRGDAVARLSLSVLAEPSDPRLRDLLQHHEPLAALEAVLAGDTPLSASATRGWRERADQLEATVDAAMVRARTTGLTWVCPGDPRWPEQLDDLDHIEPLQDAAGAPLGLWVRGTGRLVDLAQRSVAVVGARSCSTYGAEMASTLSADVASVGHTVVSGAAYGIDACAHRGALFTDRPTVAVLACGADRVYPEAHAGLLDRIAGEGGLVVSEQLPGASPLKHRFLSRNRIIAALSQGTVVIEARLRSGSLNTLHWADLLGRTTMALPGPVTSNRSDGTHAAVRGGKAVLVTSGSEVVAELGGLGMAG